MKKYTSLAHTVRSRAHARWGVLVGSSLVLGFAAVGAIAALAKGDEDGAMQVTHEEPAPYYLASSTFPLAVSGVVQAADRAVLYAETNGPVTALPAREGAHVARGALLALQATPVPDAAQSLQAAENTLLNLTREGAALGAEGSMQQAAARALTAEEVALLRSASADRRIGEATDALLATLDASVVELLTAADFVDNNRSLFTAEGLRTYEDTVAMLYGSVPNFLRGGILTGAASDDELIQTLAALKREDAPAPEDVRSLGVLVGAALRSLSEVFVSGEERALERKSTDPTSVLYSTYLGERSSVATALAQTDAALAGLARAADAAREDRAAQELTVRVSETDRALARIEHTYAQQTHAAQRAVGQAALGVRAAERSLGALHAPFAGTVAEVHRQVGEYATAGTPLLTLLGTGARELTVRVPARELSYVAEGDPFVVEGVPVGYVTRRSSVAEKGLGMVVVALTGDAPTVGESVVGALMLTVPGTYRVPRAYVHFDSVGAYVRYESGATAHATVRADRGEAFYLAIDDALPHALVPNLSATR